jgi:hypothetical protein
MRISFYCSFLGNVHSCQRKEWLLPCELTAILDRRKSLNDLENFSQIETFSLPTDSIPKPTLSQIRF